MDKERVIDDQEYRHDRTRTTEIQFFGSVTFAAPIFLLLSLMFSLNSYADSSGNNKCFLNGDPYSLGDIAEIESEKGDLVTLECLMPVSVSSTETTKWKVKGTPPEWIIVSRKQNTKKDNFNRHRYAKLIRKTVSDKLHIPPSAEKYGVARIKLKLRPNGQLDSVKIKKGSGSELLDSYIVDSVRRADKFPVPDNKYDFYKYMHPSITLEIAPDM